MRKVIGLINSLTINDSGLNNLFRYTHILFNFNIAKALRVKYCLVLAVPFVYWMPNNGCFINPLHWD